jgi:hypothetical protein
MGFKRELRSISIRRGTCQMARTSGNCALSRRSAQSPGVYQRILDTRPDHSEASDGLGVFQHQRGLLAQVEQLIAGFLPAATLS